MYYAPCMCQYSLQYQYPYYFNNPVYYSGGWSEGAISQDELEHLNRMAFLQSLNGKVKDHGPHPYVVNINDAAKENNTYRTAIWTGPHLQVTLMSIDVGGDIGLEVHPNNDQFLRIEQGRGVVRMGNNKNNLTFEKQVRKDSAIMVPAGTWHNVINAGNVPLKLYSIYAPPHHPYGTIHRTKAEAMAEE